MPLHNILTCGGWETAATGWVAAGGCMGARIGLVILFFLLAIIRKWGGEEMGVGFSFLFALVGGVVSYLVVVTLFGNFKIALLVGIVTGVVFGYGFGMFFGGEE